uniref:Uncharacterized protein n=1 Tax=Oryza punctata TaxID=4537 RepID=A0A0E0JVY8_ORYPU
MTLRQERVWKKGKLRGALFPQGITAKCVSRRGLRRSPPPMVVVVGTAQHASKRTSQVEWDSGAGDDRDDDEKGTMEAAGARVGGGGGGRRRPSGVLLMLYAAGGILILGSTAPARARCGLQIYELVTSHHTLRSALRRHHIMYCCKLKVSVKGFWI